MNLTPSQRKQEATQVTFICMVGNIILTLLKFWAGIAGSSAAMVADATHSLSDLITDFVLLIAVFFGAQPPDEAHPYGHGRMETFATFIISIVLIIVAIGIFLSGLGSVLKVVSGLALKKPSYIALAMAFVSIIVKEAMYQYTAFVGRKIDSMAVISNAWHHRSDALSSIATLLGIGGAILLGEKWAVLDPVAAMLVSVFILIIGINILKLSASEMLDSSISKEDIQKITEICLSVSGIKTAHAIKTRRVGYRMSIDLHVNIDKETTFIEVHNKMSIIEDKLRATFGSETFISIHPEPL